MKVAMMQPQFMPHQRYFELIAESDKFIFLDDLQFSYQSWHHRVKLIINGKEQMNSIPVKEKFLPQNKTEVNYDLPNIGDLLRRIEENYRKTPYFKEYFPYLRYALELQFNNLATLNMCITLSVCEILGLLKPDKFLLSSNIGTAGKSSELVIGLLEKTSADVYLCAKGSFGYMQKEGFGLKTNVKVLFQDHKPIPYYQRTSNQTEFIPYMSIFDCLFNNGADLTRETILGTSHWKEWKEMQ